MSTTFTDPVSSVDSPIPQNGLDLGPGRRRVTQQDLNLYQALVGGPPQTVDADAAAADGADAPDAAAATPRRRPFARLRKVLVLQLMDCYQGVTQRVGRPDLGAWMRRVSSDARHKLTEAQYRLTLRGARRRA